nr:unnamed protein product [Callosobruchus analis]
MASISVIKNSRGCDLLVVEEFQFCKQDVLKSGEVRWRCIKKNLRCLAKLYTVGAEYTVTRSELIHNHESDETTLERKIVTTSCKRKAEEDISEKPSKIIKSVLSNHLPENFSSTDVSLIRRNLYNSRRKLLPALPKDIHDSYGPKTTTGSDSGTDTSNSDSSTASSSQTSSDIDEAKKEVDLAGILGEDPTLQKNVGPEITGELAVRWNSYLTQRVDQETWKKLLKSYSITDNCTMLQGPMLNCEVQAMLSPTELKKGSFLYDLQWKLGKGIRILGAIITEIMAKNF